MKTTNTYLLKFLTHSVLVMTCLSAVLGVAGCQQKGPAEKVGQKIDRAAETASQKIETVKESIKQKAGQAEEHIGESAEASKGALEKAGQQVDQAAENVGKELEDVKEAVIDKAESTGEYIDDSVITTKIKAAILNDPSLSASHIEVTTVKGVVKLSGTADSQQSISRAVEVASGQQDVKSVQPELLVDESASGK